MSSPCGVSQIGRCHLSNYLKNNRRLSKDPDTDTRLMIELLGIDTFNAVRNGLGGAEIKVPKASILTDSHILVRRLGWEVAHKLCENFAAAQIYIPKRDSKNEERDGYITAAIMAGVPRTEIALNLNVSASYLRRLVVKLGLSGMVVKEPDERGLPPVPPPLDKALAISRSCTNPITEIRASAL